MIHLPATAQGGQSPRPAPRMRPRPGIAAGPARPGGGPAANVASPEGRPWRHAWPLDDVGTCCFIGGQMLEKQERRPEAAALRLDTLEFDAALNAAFAVTRDRRCR